MFPKPKGLAVAVVVLAQEAEAEELVLEAVAVCVTQVQVETAGRNGLAPEHNVRAVREKTRRRQLPQGEKHPQVRGERHLRVLAGAESVVQVVRDEATDATTRERMLDEIIGDGEETELFSQSV
jgi:hypothetical protein